MSAKSSLARGKAADVLYDIFFLGAVGGSAVALYFVLLDLVEGRTFATASMVGSVLFRGAEARMEPAIHMGMVALLAIVHVAIFAGIAVVCSRLEQALALHDTHPILVLAVFFAVISTVGFAGAAIFLPKVLGVLGVGHVLLANLLAAGAMTAALRHGHRGAMADADHPLPRPLVDSRRM